MPSSEVSSPVRKNNQRRRRLSALYTKGINTQLMILSAMYSLRRLMHNVIKRFILSQWGSPMIRLSEQSNTQTMASKQNVVAHPPYCLNTVPTNHTLQTMYPSRRIRASVVYLLVAGAGPRHQEAVQEGMEPKFLVLEMFPHLAQGPHVHQPLTGRNKLHHVSISYTCSY